MAQWKKVIVSGSSAQLSQLSVDTSVNITGSLNASSSVFLRGLTNASQATIVSIDAATGQLFYQGTGSFTANSASYALSASRATSAANADNATSASYALNATSASRAISAASADNATSASYALSSSYALNASTADSATSASRATSAANADNATSASFAASGNGTFSGSFSGSFQGNGGGLTNIPASGIVGLQLNQIASGSATASIAPDLGFRVNTDTQITGSLSISSSASTLKIEGNGFGQTYFSTNGALVLNPGSGGVGMAGVNQYMTLGYVVGQTAGTQLTGSFTGSFKGDGSQLSGVIATAGFALSEGAGITDFSYDGGTSGVTVAVSGASALSSNAVTKWSGNAFVNSSITDSTNVTINNNGGVLVQSGGLYVTGASTFHDNVVMQANLTVQGTASFQNVENLAVKDQFVLLNSGSTTFQDSGIVINTGNSANSGSAFFLETAGTTTGTNALNGRFAVASGVLPDATSATAAEYAVTALISGSAPGVSVPQFGGTGLGQGNMWVDSSTSDIWIYA